jgi:hypothetical protein
LFVLLYPFDPLGLAQIEEEERRRREMEESAEQRARAKLEDELDRRVSICLSCVLCSLVTGDSTALLATTPFFDSL